MVSSDVDEAKRRLKDAGKAADTVDVQKSARDAATDILRKSLDIPEDEVVIVLVDANLGKFAGSVASIELLKKSFEEASALAIEAAALAKKYTDLAAQPRAPKGALQAVPVTKTADREGGEEEIDPAKAKDPAHLIKSAHQSGGIRIL